MPIDRPDSNVVYLGGVTKLDLPADRILEKCAGQLEGVVVIGYTKDGDEYFVSSYADGENSTSRRLNMRPSLASTRFMRESAQFTKPRFRLGSMRIRSTASKLEPEHGLRPQAETQPRKDEEVNAGPI